MRRTADVYKMAGIRKICMNLCIVVGYYILFQSFYNLIDSRSIWPYKDIHQFYVYFLLNFIPITIIYIINYSIVFKCRTFNVPVKKLITDIVFSFLAMSLMNITYTFIMSYIAPRYSNVNWAGTVFNNIFILLGIEVAYFVQYHIKQIKEISENRQKILQYQYDTLRAQINPHFLFNTLNILYMLVGKDTQKSKQFILALSNIYRYVQNQQGHDKTQLEDEIQFVSEYSKILSLRYSNNFTLIMEQKPERQHMIVPFTLQLLVENAVKHNKISANTPLTVRLAFKDDRLTISNRINRKPQQDSTKIGLKYLKTLYSAYGKQIIITDENNTFTVEIPYI